MAFAIYQTTKTSFVIKKLAGVTGQIIQTYSKAVATPGILGLGGKIGKGAATPEVPRSKNHSALPVEGDTKKLATYLCGSNILKEGGEDVKLKPDSEYPSWLWTLKLGRCRHYSQLSPNDMDYWKQLKKLYYKERLRVKAKQRF